MNALMSFTSPTPRALIIWAGVRTSVAAAVGDASAVAIPPIRVKRVAKRAIEFKLLHKLSFIKVGLSLVEVW